MGVRSAQECELLRASSRLLSVPRSLPPSPYLSQAVMWDMNSTSPMALEIVPEKGDRFVKKLKERGARASAHAATVEELSAPGAGGIWKPSFGEYFDLIHAKSLKGVHAPMLAVEPEGASTGFGAHASHGCASARLMQMHDAGRTTLPSLCPQGASVPPPPASTHPPPSLPCRPPW